MLYCVCLFICRSIIGSASSLAGSSKSSQGHHHQHHHHYHDPGRHTLQAHRSTENTWSPQTWGFQQAKQAPCAPQWLSLKRRQYSDKSKECKERKRRIKRTYCSCALRKGIAHDIRVMSHRTLSSKGIRTIGVDRPRQVGKVNRATCGRVNRILTWLAHLNIITCNICKIKKGKRRGGRYILQWERRAWNESH